MLISVVLCTYNEMPYKLPVAVHSLLDQTYRTFELQVWHDGRDSESWQDTLAFAQEHTHHFSLRAKGQRRGLTGYPMRQDALEEVAGEYVVFTNGDNWHSRDYLEYFAREVKADPSLDFVYVNGLHDYGNPGRPWTVLDSQPGMGAIDMAFFMTRTSLAREIGFTADFGRGGDGTFVNTLVARGAKMKKVPNGAVTVVHG